MPSLMNHNRILICVFFFSVATGHKREEFVGYYVPLYMVTKANELPRLLVNCGARSFVKTCRTHLSSKLMIIFKAIIISFFLQLYNNIVFLYECRPLN